MTATMRAAIVTSYGGPDTIRIEERPTPAPGRGQILIRVVTTTINTADWRIRSLILPRGFGPLARPMFGFTRPRNPVLGAECAGIVTALGAGVTAFAPGDAVIAYTGGSMGCHAEYVAVPVTKVIRKPDILSWDQAAALSFGGCTALSFLDTVNLGPGRRILVIGAPGTVGSAAIQIAHAAGAQVDATASPGNADLVRSLGAATILDNRATDLSQGGADWDVILDAVGAETWPRMKPRLRSGGRFLIVAGSLMQLLSASVTRGDRRPVSTIARERAEDMQRLAILATAGQYRPLIDSTYPFDRIAEAHARVDSGRKRGSVILRVGLESAGAEG